MCVRVFFIFFCGVYDLLVTMYTLKKKKNIDAVHTRYYTTIARITLNAKYCP